MLQHVYARAGILLAVLGCTSIASAGPDWLEQGDAGSTISAAQLPARPVGATGLFSISGVLASAFTEPDYEDLYRIRITDPVNFSIRPAFADFNVVMYLFNITVNNEGYGLLGADDESPTSNLPKLVGSSNDGTEVIVTYPGDYVLAVTGFGRTPVSRTGPIFNFESPTEITGPDGRGGINPLAGWTGVGETGRYSFTLVATDFPITPAPSAGLAVVGGLGAMGLRRRRR
jgi:hypothetical protein